MTDIDIAKKASIKPIIEIARRAGISESSLELYGNYKCKINIDRFDLKGKLILVSAMNPTPLGEGKTTVTIGLADGLRRLGKSVFAALREPSLGPVFGMKGGACGGGYSQIVPMADINLHFNGDLHAITAANNLLSAAIDNHIYQGNTLKINPERILWRRCMDMNDRNLRNIRTGLGREVDGVTLDTGFNITAASEIMAILCLSNSLEELKQRLADITVAYDLNDNPVRCSQLKIHNAMTILLKEAIKPNLVQTLEGTPVLVHGGPFANIAHGCNSIIATKTGLTYGEYCVTEAGFGADLGCEKFIDVKCRIGGLKPDCVALVATVKALKYNAGIARESLTIENIDALRIGFENLKKHIENVTGVFKIPCVVAINRFAQDGEGEIEEVIRLCRTAGASAEVITAYSEGGAGAQKLAEEVIRLSANNSAIDYVYKMNDSIVDKLNAIVKRIYGGIGIRLINEEVRKEIERLDRGYTRNYPVIVAKTQYSLSDNPKLLNRPQDFYVDIRDVQVKSGAGFIVAVAGDIMLMPGLPKIPSYEIMDIDNDGNISGLS